MRAWTAVAAVLLVAGCGGKQGGFGAPATGPVETPPPPPAATTAKPGPASSGPDAARGTLPDLVGKGLQVAQDDAQAAGFDSLTSHDGLGRGRHQFWDRDWRVCFQSPAPGKRATDTEIDFGAVKLDEKCPKSDQGAGEVEKAGATMPDLVGKSLAIAEQTLGSNASLTIEDGSGHDRFVLVASNWQVCAQKPKAGKSFDGVPVTLTVVTFDEKC